MHTRFLLLVIAATSCDGTSKPKPATQSDADAAKPSPAAAARCPAGTYAHSDPAFCVPLPEGFAPERQPSSVEFRGPDDRHFTVSWAPIDERAELEARARMDWTVGGQDRGVGAARGVRWEQTSEERAIDVFMARAFTATHVVTCSTYFMRFEPPEAVLEACKGLQVEGADPVTKTAISDVPAYVAGTANAAQRKAAVALNVAGVQRLHAGDLTGARDKLVAALLSDPGHILARYNLACALSRAGEHLAALTLLAELSATELCDGCRRQLVHAASDSDFADLRRNPVFQRIVGPAAQHAAAYADAASRLAHAIATRSASELAALVDTQVAVKLRRNCGRCDGPEKVTNARGKDAVLAGIFDIDDLTTTTKTACDATGCCTYDIAGLAEEPDVYFGDGSPPRLDRACFTKTSTGKLVVSELAIEYP